MYTLGRNSSLLDYALTQPERDSYRRRPSAERTRERKFDYDERLKHEVRPIGIRQFAITNTIFLFRNSEENGDAKMSTGTKIGKEEFKRR